MLKQKRICCLVVLILCLVFLLLTTGCARKTIPPGETLTGQTGRLIAEQAREAPSSGVKQEEPVRKAPLIESSPRTPTATVASSPAPPPAVPPPQPIREEVIREAPVRPEKIVLKKLYFEFDKYNLSTEAREILREHAQRLLKLPDFALVIEGHCDERGTNEYNLALGERRAVEAMKYLVALGVNEKKIRTVSYGEELPADPGSSEEAWAKNRRAEFNLTVK